MQVRAASVLALMLLSASAMADTWNASTELTAGTSSNPNGVWSYGYDPAAQAGYQFRAFNQFTLQLGGTSPTWRDATYQSLGTPSILRNLSAGTVDGVLPGQLSLHPGPSGNGDQAILRFTAPVTGAYDVQGQFFAGDSGQTEAWIVRNGNFAAPLLSIGITSLSPTFSASLALGVGDTLDFVVGNSGDFLFDNTPLALTISSVPEPKAMLLLMAGLAGLMLAARRAGSPKASTSIGTARVWVGK